LVIEVTDNSGDRILFVGEDRAAIQTGWVGAVMTGRRDRLLKRVCGVVADKQPDIPPGFIFIQTVEGVAPRDTRLASSAGIQVHLEGILFVDVGLRERDEFREASNGSVGRLHIVGP